MSPFEDVAERLGDRLTGLSRRAQALFYACASEVLLPAYARWVELEPQAYGQVSLLEYAVGEAREFAVTGVVPSGLAELVAQMELGAPEAEGFIAAQDAWIAGTIALQVAHGQFDVRGGVWYVLEPQFQAVSERLFGVSDVGSVNEEQGESTALNAPTLVAAVWGIERAVELLSTKDEPNMSDVVAVTEELTAVAV